MPDSIFEGEAYAATMRRAGASSLHRWYLRHLYQQTAALLPAAPPPRKLRVLLCGCAAPETALTLTEFLRPRTAALELTVLDLGSAQVGAAVAALAGLPGVSAQGCVADARRLPFPDTSFDLVESDFLLQFLDDDGRRALLSGWARVLSPGGAFMTRDFLPRDPPSVVEAWLDERRIRAFRERLGASTYRLSFARAKALAAEAGLQVQSGRARWLGVRLPLIGLLAGVRPRLEKSSGS